MPPTVTAFKTDMTLKWELTAGDYIVWVRWKGIFSSARNLEVLDFWEMREGDMVTTTSRIADLPDWFELHPTEVSGFRACSMMQKKLKEGYRPTDPLDGPNLWRVLAGDRVVRVNSEQMVPNNEIQFLANFECNALVFGERLVHPQDLAWFLSFGAPLEQPNPRVVRAFQAGMTAVKNMGPPRVMAADERWTLGT